jgi:hypothetical protein
VLAGSGFCGICQDEAQLRTGAGQQARLVLLAQRRQGHVALVAVLLREQGNSPYRVAVHVALELPADRVLAGHDLAEADADGLLGDHPVERVPLPDPVDGFGL